MNLEFHELNETFESLCGRVEQATKTKQGVWSVGWSNNLDKKINKKS